MNPKIQLSTELRLDSPLALTLIALIIVRKAKIKTQEEFIHRGISNIEPVCLHQTFLFPTF